MTTPLYSISISARATLDMHSLNNEGGEGNQIQTRMVNIIDQSRQLQNVNAISGDMFKHIQAEHLFHIAREDSNLPLCAGCREFNANRINADPQFQAILAEVETYKDKKGKNKTRNKYSDSDVIDYLLNACVIDDIEGILITSAGKKQDDESSDSSDEDADGDSETGRAKKRSLPRKSVIEFGWVVGVPGSVETDSYFHVKYASSDRTKTAEQRESEEQSGENIGQAIFHRPASSGIYATVCHLELSRIGFNDIKQEYAITDEQRERRARALLESVLYTYMQPNGAMRSAQAPHLVEFSGVLSYSTGPVPAPTVSPLKDDYDTQIFAIQSALESVAPGKVGVVPFASLGEFTGIVGDLVNNGAPYKLLYQ